MQIKVNIYYVEKNASTCKTYKGGYKFSVILHIKTYNCGQCSVTCSYQLGKLQDRDKKMDASKNWLFMPIFRHQCRPFLKHWWFYNSVAWVKLHVFWAVRSAARVARWGSGRRGARWGWLRPAAAGGCTCAVTVVSGPARRYGGCACAVTGRRAGYIRLSAPAQVSRCCDPSCEWSRYLQAG